MIQITTMVCSQISLECEVKWALGSITTTKLVEVMEVQLSHFKS